MDPLLDFYNRALGTHGPESPRALGWRDAHSQQSRFKVLGAIGDLSGASVLDEGCGLGDFYPFLRERFPDVRYTGIDINPELVLVARAKYPEAEFHIANFTTYQHEPFNYVLASGALTFKLPDYKEVYFAQVRKMYELASIAVGFNMLDLNRIGDDPVYAAYDPAEVEAFCRTFAREVRLRHDYSDEDFTVYLYR